MSKLKTPSVEESTIETSPLPDESSLLLPTSISKPAYNIKTIVITLWLGVFLSAMDGTIVANIMGPISASFEQEELKQWIATSYLLSGTAFTPLYGKVSDIVGRKYALLFGQFFFGLGCFLCSFANSVPQFAYARAVSGIGGGGVAAICSVVLSDVLTLEERGLYQGYSNLVYAFAQVTGAPLGSWALNNVGWRWAFGLQSPLILLCMVLTYRNINIKPKKEFHWGSFQRIDFGGCFTLVGFILSFLLILSTDLNKKLLVTTGTVSLLLFIIIEKYIAKEQIVPLELFKGELGGIHIISFLALFSMTSYYFGLPVFLQVVQNQSITASGHYLTVAAFPISFGSLGTGFILRRYGSKSGNTKRFSSRITLVAFLLVAVAYTILQYIYLVPSPYNTTIGWKLLLVFSLGVFGIGYGSLLVSTLITMVGIVGPEGHAAATSLNFLFRSIGIVLGTGLSLSNYEFILSRKLSVLLKDIANGDTILKKLLHNANYLKTSKDIDEELKINILYIYQKAVAYSFTPAVAFSYLAVLLAAITFFKRST